MGRVHGGLWTWDAGCDNIGKKIQHLKKKKLNIPKQKF